MSQKKTPKKKVVVTTSKSSPPAKRTTATTRTRRSSRQPAAQPMLFGRQHFIMMGIGIVLIILGMLLMLGGEMPSPDVWEPDRIYSTRRTVLAPMFILTGLVVEIFAIFKQPKTDTQVSEDN